MKNVIKVAVYASVGLYDKMKEEIDELVRRGEIKQQEAKALVDMVEEGEHGRMRDMADKIEHRMKKALDRLPPVAMRREMALIEEHLSDLENRVQRLEVADLAEAEDLQTGV